MFVLQARFPHEDPILGAWSDENDAVADANRLDRPALAARLEAADCECDVEDLEELRVVEVWNEGVERDVWNADAEVWLAHHE